jgi:hypothetical protein
MKIYDASPLHDTNRDGVVLDWGDLKVMSADGTNLSLAALRDPALSGEGACLLVYNYCEKEYYDANVPVPLVFDPENDDAPVLEVPAATGLIGTWAIDVETPFNWAYSRNVNDTTPAGKLMNNWTALADYLATSWCGYTQAIHDSIATNNSFITFATGGAVTWKTGVAGTDSVGTYSLTAPTIIQFTNITPRFTVGTQSLTTSPVSAATASNQLRITSLTATSLWLGQRNTTPGKEEYTVFHFVKQP